MSIKKILNDFLKIDGVIGAVLVGYDGFVIEYASIEGVDVDGIGAIVASSIEASEMMGKELKLGQLEQYLLEFTKGRIIIITSGNMILAIVTNQQVIIGNVRFTAKTKCRELMKLL